MERLPNYESLLAPLPELIRHLTRLGATATLEQVVMITHKPSWRVRADMMILCRAGQIVPCEGGWRRRIVDDDRVDPSTHGAAWGYDCKDFRRLRDFAASLEQAGCTIEEIYGLSTLPGVVTVALTHPTLDIEDLDALVKDLDQRSQSGPARGLRGKYFTS